MAKIPGVDSSGKMIGEIFSMGSNDPVPPGCFDCNGAAVSRVRYAKLFAKLGVTWGAGDGLTTFNLPGAQGRSLVGEGTGAGLSARTVGQLIGEENHLLTTGELPPHNHTLGASNYSVFNADAGATGFFMANSNSGVTGSTGGNNGHNNMQPSAVVKFAIAYK